MLPDGGASSNHGSGARPCGIRTAEQSGLHRTARNDSVIASIACAHRTHARSGDMGESLRPTSSVSSDAATADVLHETLGTLVSRDRRLLVSQVRGDAR